MIMSMSRSRRTKPNIPSVKSSTKYGELVSLSLITMKTSSIASKMRALFISRNWSMFRCKIRIPMTNSTTQKTYTRRTIHINSPVHSFRNMIMILVMMQISMVLGQFPLDTVDSYVRDAVQDPSKFLHNHLEIHSRDYPPTQLLIPATTTKEGVHIPPRNKTKVYMITSGGAGPGGLGDVMNAAIPSFQLALDDINANPNYLVDVQLALVTAGDSRCCQSCTTRNIAQMMHDRLPTDGHTLGFLGDFCSGGGCLQVNDFAAALRMPVFSPYCQSGLFSNTKNYEAFTRFAVHSVIQGRAMGDFLADVIMPAAKNIHNGNPKVQNKIRYAKVYENKAINSGAVAAMETRLFERLSAENLYEDDPGVPGSGRYNKPLMLGAPGAFKGMDGKLTANWQQVTDTVKALKDLDHRLIVISFYQSMGTVWFCEVYRQKWYGYHTYLWTAMWLDFNWIEQGYKSLKGMLTDAGCTKENIYEAAQGMIGIGTSFWNPNTNDLHALSGKSMKTIKSEYWDYCKRNSYGWCYAATKNRADIEGGLYPIEGSNDKSDYNDTSKCNDNIGPYGYDSVWSVALTLDTWLKFGRQKVSPNEVWNGTHANSIHRLATKPGGGLYDHDVAREIHEISADEQWLGVTGVVKHYRSSYTIPGTTSLLYGRGDREGSYSVRQVSSEKAWGDTEYMSDLGVYTPPAGFFALNGTVPVAANTTIPPVGALTGSSWEWAKGKLIRWSVAKHFVLNNTDLYPNGCRICTGIDCPENCIPNLQGPACGLGQTLNGEGICERCAKGTGAELDTLQGMEIPGRCAKPGVGQYVDGKGVYPRILDCQPGTYSTLEALQNINMTDGSTYCLLCPPGFYSAKARSASCTETLPGTFTKVLGSAAPKNCARGTYQPEPNRDLCITCGEGRTTLGESATSAKECVCAQNSYERKKADGTTDCVPCRQGMICNVGATEDNLGDLEVKRFLVKPGFWMQLTGEVGADLGDHMYQCDIAGELAITLASYETPCPGGPPETCATGRTGIACGRCKDGWYQEGSGPCAKCKPGDEWIMPIFGLILMLSSLSAYQFVNAPITANMSPIAIMVASFGAFVTTMQMCAVMGKMSLSWPQSLQGMWLFVSIFALDIRIFRGDCAMGGDPVISYLYRVLFPYVLVGLLFLVAWISRKYYPVNHIMHMQLPETINTFGTTFQAAYITLLLSVIQAFRCYEHPNAKSSVATFPDILCGEREHNGMVLVAFLGMIPLICFLFFYVYQVVIIPSRSLESATFFRPIKFIIYRFHAGAWYWGSCFLLRNFCMTMGTLIDPARPFKQTLFLFIILVIYICFQVAIWPWRNRAINLLDCIQSCCVLIMLCAAMSLLGHSDSQTRELAGIVIATAFSVAIGTLIGYLFSIILDWIQLTRNPDYKQHRELVNFLRAEEVYVRIKHLSEKVMIDVREEHVREFCYNVTEVDYQRLIRMLHMLTVELIPHTADFIRDQQQSMALGDRRVRSNLALSERDRKVDVDDKADTGLRTALNTVRVSVEAADAAWSNSSRRSRGMLNMIRRSQKSCSVTPPETDGPGTDRISVGIIGTIGTSGSGGFVPVNLFSADQPINKNLDWKAKLQKLDNTPPNSYEKAFNYMERAKQEAEKATAAENKSAGSGGNVSAGNAVGGTENAAGMISAGSATGESPVPDRKKSRNSSAEAENIPGQVPAQVNSPGQVPAAQELDRIVADE